MSKPEVTLAQREQITLFTKELAAVLRRIAGRRLTTSASTSESLANQVAAVPIQRDTPRAYSSANTQRSSHESHSTGVD